MTRNPNHNAAENPATQAFRQMSTQDFSRWGVGNLAYVKKVSLQDGEAFAIHAADGEPLGIAASRDAAFAGLRQNDLEPLSVH